MKKLVILFLSIVLLAGCGQHKDTPNINKTAPIKNSVSKADQTPRPAVSPSVAEENRKPLLDRFMDVATNEEFFRIFSAVQPVKKVDFPHSTKYLRSSTPARFCTAIPSKAL